MRPHLGGIVTPSSYHFFKASPTPCCKKHQAPAGTRLHVTVPHTSELVTRAASLDSAAWDDSLERQGFCFGNWWQSVDLEIPWDKPSQIGWPYYFHTISHPPVWMPSNNLDHNCSNVKNRAASQTSWRPRVIPNSVLQGLQFFVPQNSMSLFARNSGSSRSSCPTWTRCSRIFPWTTSTKSMTWAITWDPQRLCIRHHKNIITQLNIYIYIYIIYII